MNDQNNLQMLWTRVVHWLVKLSRLKAQSHMTFLDAHKNRWMETQLIIN